RWSRVRVHQHYQSDQEDCRNESLSLGRCQPKRNHVACFLSIAVLRDDAIKNHVLYPIGHPGFIFRCTSRPLGQIENFDWTRPEFTLTVDLQSATQVLLAPNSPFPLISTDEIPRSAESVNLTQEADLYGSHSHTSSWNRSNGRRVRPIWTRVRR